MKEAIKAALFDVDGTLLDTTELIYQAYEHTFEMHGCAPVPRKEMAVMIGKPLEECYRNFSPSHDPSVLAETHRIFQSENLHLSLPFPNTQETLSRLKDANIKIAAITTRSRRTSLRTLELAGIAEKIDVFVSGEDVEKHKPHPDSLIRALGELDVPPAKAVMIGDTDVDVFAGKNAGTKTIGVTYGFHGERIKKSDPDHTVDDIMQVIPIILVTLKELAED